MYRATKACMQAPRLKTLQNPDVQPPKLDS